MKQSRKVQFVMMFLCLVVVGAFATSQQAQAETVEAGQSDLIPNQYIVVMADDAPPANSRSSVVARYQIPTKHVYSKALNGFSAELDKATLDALEKEPSVAYIVQDRMVELDTTQYPVPSWGLDRINQRNLPIDFKYTYTNAGSGVNAYIIDTGIRATHTEFGGRVLGGQTYILDGRGWDDCNGHGTHVAGTVGGTNYGVAKNVNLYAVRVFGCTGGSPYSTIIAAVDWVSANYVAPAVVNMSLGGSAYQPLDDAINNSIALGITYVVSGGNSNNDACLYSPARVANAITVGATDSSDARAYYSNYGQCTDIFAPGSFIQSAWYTSDSAISSLSGTSMAAPHVAGVAALYLEMNPTATPSQVKTDILNVATPNVVTNPGTGSPNLLLYSLVNGEPSNQRQYIMSFNRNGSMPTFNFKDEDLLIYDEASDSWDMFLDLSNHGITKDTDAFMLLPSGNMLLSFNVETTVPGLGLVDDSDVVEFDRINSTFTMYFDGSDVGLDTNGEDVDAISLWTNGSLLISTIGSHSVNGGALNGKDEDVLIFLATSMGDTTAGSFAVFTDGSDIGMNQSGNEDLWGLSIGIGQIHMTTKAEFEVPGATSSVTGNGRDVFACVDGQLGDPTTCVFEMQWQGDPAGAPSVNNNSIDALHVIEP